MAKLFGIDIAKLVNSEIKKAGGVRPLTLTKTTPGARTPGDLSAGNNPTTTTHTGAGFVELASARRTGQVGAAVSGETISILGASVLPAAEPTVNDTVTLDGSTYLLIKLVSRDPASALYSFEAQVV